MTMKVMVIGEAIMLTSVFIFIIMDGIIGTMVVFTDGAGTILVMQDFMDTAGLNHGDGTDGIDGTIGVMAVLDLDGTTGDLDGTDLFTVIILDMHMVMVMVMATDITVATIDSLTEIMH